MTGETSIPILCYHAIQDGPRPLHFPPSRFRLHIEALQSSGAITLTIADVGRHIREGRPFPKRSVALTFDDAIASVFTAAFPIIEAAGFVATVFAVTGYLGRRSDWNGRQVDKLPIMSGEELRALHDAGWEVGSHTDTHPRLTELESSSIRNEMRRSSDVLSEFLGVSPRSFAYPFGLFNASVRAVAGELFDSCVAIGARRAALTSSPDLIDRIDAWYVPKARQVARLRGSWMTAYLSARRLARHAQAVN